MKRATPLVVALVLCCAIAAQSAVAPRVQTQSLQMTSIQKIGAITRSQLLQQLNKPMTFEGFFYDGSIPMLVESMELVRLDKAIPPDKYVPIVGPVPSSFMAGAKVRISGQVQKPTGEKVKQENVALQVTAQARASVLQSAASGILSQSAIAVAAPPPPPAPLPNHYALLIGTGKNPANDYVRYWNDQVRMYQLLLSKGYSPANIRVVHSNGVPKSASMPVHYPASMGGVQAAFTYFVPKVKADGYMYIMVVGQGDQVSTSKVYWLWMNTPMYPGAFAMQVNRITTYNRMVIHLHHPYSGAFIPSLTRPKRVIVTAARADRSTYCHPSHLYGNFNYWYLSALRGHLLLGEAPVDADTNNNGQVSIGEAYNFTLPRPGGPAGSGIPPILYQMPQFEDTGTPPSRYGHLPTYGEGLVGLVTHL